MTFVTLPARRSYFLLKFLDLGMFRDRFAQSNRPEKALLQSKAQYLTSLMISWKSGTSKNCDHCDVIIIIFIPGSKWIFYLQQNVGETPCLLLFIHNFKGKLGQLKHSLMISFYYSPCCKCSLYEGKINSLTHVDTYNGTYTMQCCDMIYESYNEAFLRE